MPQSDTYFRRAINWMYGEQEYLQRQVPEELGKKHVNELLGRHPWHPYDPDMSPTHPCFQANQLFAQCMGHPDFEDLELHMKHVTCYHPMKVDLMKCLTREKRKEKLRLQEQQQQQQLVGATSNNDTNASNISSSSK